MWKALGIFAVVVVLGGVLFLGASIAWRMIRSALGKKGKGQDDGTS